jgi:hypothetical protein
MGGLFGGPKTPTLPPPPAPPQRSDAEIQAEGTATRRRLASARGRASTILSAGQATDTPSAKRVLLGE